MTVNRDEQQVTAAPTFADEEIVAIRQLVADAEKYQNDLEPFVALHTADAIIVNIAGRRVLGRDAIHTAVKKALETPLAKVITKSEIDDVRFVSKGVAIVVCTKHVFDEREDALGASLPSKGSLTYVIVKEPDAWRIASAQTTPMVNS